MRPKEKNEEKPSQEILDQFRYIGLKIYEDTQEEQWDYMLKRRKSYKSFVILHSF